MLGHCTGIRIKYFISNDTPRVKHTPPPPLPMHICTSPPPLPLSQTLKPYTHPPLYATGSSSPPCSLYHLLNHLSATAYSPFTLTSVDPIFASASSLVKSRFSSSSRD